MAGCVNQKMKNKTHAVPGLRIACAYDPVLELCLRFIIVTEY